MTAAESPTHSTPSSGHSLARTPASRGSLVAAWLVDLAVVGLPALLSWYLGRSLMLGVLVASELVVVLVVVRAATGRTPGAWATRVVTVAEGSDHAPGLRRELIHAALWLPLHLTVVGPVVTIALGRQGRDWTDRVAGTASYDLRTPVQTLSLERDAYGRPVLPASPDRGWTPGMEGPGTDLLSVGHGSTATAAAQAHSSSARSTLTSSCRKG